MRKVGILGGTFDPVHWGHLAIAQTALTQVKLNQVIWVPNQCPPHKQAAMFEHRWQMVQRAIADHPAFSVSSSGNREQLSYAITTLIELQAIYPNTHWYWIIGLDAFQTLPRWYQRQQFVPQCDWLVAPRLVPAGINAQSQLCEQVAQKLAAECINIRWQILQMPLLGVSSSLIRQYCRDGRSIRYLVPEAVRLYITTHNLYSQASLKEETTKAVKRAQSG